MRYKNWCGAIAFAIVLVLVPMVSRAATGLVISEVMYDLPGSDADHEWIEIYNPTSLSVPIVGGSGTGSWRFNDGSNHYLAETPLQGSMTIAPGGYAIIAGDAATFLSDHAGFSGTIIDTSMSLPNTGGTVKLVDDSGNIVDSMTYASSQGASADGNSLQLASDSSWIAAAPTPGSATVATTSSTGTDTTGTAGTTTTTASGTAASVGGASSVPPTATAYDPFVMSAHLNAPLAGTAGIPVTISASLTDYNALLQPEDPFHFALGDGTEEDQNFPEPFQHTYKFPGTYVISLSYRSESYLKTPDVTAEQTIDIAAPTVSISAVHPDGSIDLSNSGDSKADISNWSIVSFADPAAKPFLIPFGTSIVAGGTVTLPIDVTGFAQADTASLELLLSSGTVAAMYDGEALVAGAAAEAAAPAISATESAALKNIPTPKTALSSQQNDAAFPSVSTSGISASVLQSVSPEPNVPAASSGRHALSLFIFGLAGVIVVSIIAMRSLHVFQPLTPNEEMQTVSDTKKIADTIRIVEE